MSSARMQTRDNCRTTLRAFPEEGKESEPRIANVSWQRPGPPSGRQSAGATRAAVPGSADAAAPDPPPPLP